MLCVPFFQSGDGFARENLNALLSIVVGDELRKVAWENAVANSVTRENHHHLFPVQRQSRGNLRTDEATSDDCKAFLFFGERAQPPIIRKRPVVDDAILAERHLSRSAAGCQKQFVEGVGESL